MAIGAITGVSAVSYSSSITPSKKLQEDDNLEVEQTQALEENNQIEEEAENIEVQPEENDAETNNFATLSSLPYYSTMISLGLTPTGNEETDYNETVNRLNTLIKYTTDEEDLETYLELADRISLDFDIATKTISDPESMTGANQISEINKLLLVNESSEDFLGNL